jgi:hypothetical protein
VELEHEEKRRGEKREREEGLVARRKRKENVLFGVWLFFFAFFLLCFACFVAVAAFHLWTRTREEGRKEEGE